MRDDDASLVRSAQRGDRAALAAVLKRHERTLFSSAHAMLRSSWDAEDAVQETMYEACAKLWSVREPDRFRAWLATILLRKCQDCLRRRMQEPVTVEYELRAEQALAFVGSERDEDVLSAIVAMREEYRLLLALRFYLDLSYEDIAAATGWPLGTVQSRLSRALLHLRATVRKAGMA